MAKQPIKDTTIKGRLEELKKDSMAQSNAWADAFNKPSGGGGYAGEGGFRATYATRDTLNPSLPGVQKNDAEARALALDPWSYYRSGAADNLAKFSSQEDPASVFRNRLTQMSMGQFSPNDPSYKWRFEQGQQAVERSLGARGLLNSGNAAIELQQYGQGAASQEYAAQFSRLLQGMQGVESQYESQFSRLSQMAGISLDPGASAKIDAGIQQAQIGASAQVASSANSAAGNVAAASAGQASGLARVGLDREINQQQENRYAAYDKGLGDALKGRNA